MKLTQHREAQGLETKEVIIGSAVPSCDINMNNLNFSKP